MLSPRLLAVITRAALSPRIGALDTSVLSLRVLPTDLDINVHMNNGRYLSVMDLGRYDLWFRNGLATQTLKHRWQPLVAAASLRYRRSLNPFEKFELHTRIACWDEKWMFFEQRFEVDGQLCATGRIQAVIRSRGGNVPPSEVLGSVGWHSPSPEMPEGLRRWQSSLTA